MRRNRTYFIKSIFLLEFLFHFPMHISLPHYTVRIHITFPYIQSAYTYQQIFKYALLFLIIIIHTRKRIHIQTFNSIHHYFIFLQVFELFHGFSNIWSWCIVFCALLPAALQQPVSTAKHSVFALQTEFEVMCMHMLFRVQIMCFIMQKLCLNFKGGGKKINKNSILKQMFCKIIIVKVFLIIQYNTSIFIFPCTHINPTHVSTVYAY